MFQNDFNYVDKMYYGKRVRKLKLFDDASEKI